MKKIFILILLILLAGCANQENANDSLWNKIEGKEFSNYDVFAGQGVYFFEEEGTRYCKFMKYGSGVPIFAEYTSEVTFDEDGKMLIELPYALIVGIYDDESFWEDIDETTFTFGDGNILWGNLTFEETDITCHDGC